MFPLRDTVPSSRPPVVTVGLILVNAAVFLFQMTLPPELLDRLFQVYGLVPARFTDPAWGRFHELGFSLAPLFTSQFLHGGLMHLLGNLWMLWIFGDNVEDRLGKVRFLIFYLGVGGFAGLVHFLSSPGSPVPVVGASGAIAGVLGAYFLLYPHSRVLTVVPVLFYPLLLEIPAFLFLGLWFVLQLFSGTLSLLAAAAGGIAWWAHIGGFAAGMLGIRWFKDRLPRPRISYPWGSEGPPVIEVPGDDEEPRQRRW